MPDDVALLAVDLGQPEPRIPTEHLQTFLAAVRRAGRTPTVWAPKDPEAAGVLNDAIRYAQPLAHEVIRLRSIIREVDAALRDQPCPACHRDLTAHREQCPVGNLQREATEPA